MAAGFGQQPIARARASCSANDCVSTHQNGTGRMWVVMARSSLQSARPPGAPSARTRSINRSGRTPPLAPSWDPVRSWARIPPHRRIIQSHPCAVVTPDFYRLWGENRRQCDCRRDRCDRRRDIGRRNRCLCWCPGRQLGRCESRRRCVGRHWWRRRSWPKEEPSAKHD